MSTGWHKQRAAERRLLKTIAEAHPSKRLPKREAAKPGESALEAPWRASPVLGDGLGEEQTFAVGTKVIGVRGNKKQGWTALVLSDDGEDWRSFRSTQKPSCS